jgi:ribosomal protein S18 acetylase RimI-like enzyme
MLAMYVDDNCRSAFITNVSVTGDHTGLGIASELIRRTVDIARCRDCMAIALQVDLNNHRAITLYEKFHFRIEGESQNPISMVLSL